VSTYSSCNIINANSACQNGAEQYGATVLDHMEQKWWGRTIHHYRTDYYPCVTVDQACVTREQEAEKKSKAQQETLASLEDLDSSILVGSLESVQVEIA
jgi:hypothetical protein